MLHAPLYIRHGLFIEHYVNVAGDHIIAFGYSGRTRANAKIDVSELAALHAGMQSLGLQFDGKPS